MKSQKTKNKKQIATAIVAWIMLLTPLFWRGVGGEALAQVTFQKLYGGSAQDMSNRVRQTKDCGFVIVGFTESFGAGGRDVYMVKTAADGSLSWTKTFGGTGKDEGRDVKQTTDGGFIITGITGMGNGGQDVYLIKTDATGNMSWSKTFGGTNTEDAQSVSQTSDGGYIIAGSTKSYGQGDYDIYLIKTDATGNISWTKTFGGIKEELGYYVQQTKDGGYIITGSTQSYGAGVQDVYLIKTDASGTISWTKTFGSNNWDNSNYVEQTSDGGYIIAAYTMNAGFLPSGVVDGVWLIKTNSTGTLDWNKTYTAGGYNSWGAEVHQTTDGGYVVVSSVRAPPITSSYDTYVIKTTSTGNVGWSKAYGGTGYDDGWSVVQTTDGGYAITSEKQNGTDFYLIKTDANGSSGCNEKNITTTVINPTPSVSSGGTTATGGTGITPATITGSGGTETLLCKAGNSVSPTITPAGPFCQSAAAVNLTAASTGGVWSGTGITDTAKGTFNPSVAGIGTHIIKYKLIGSCGSDSDTVAIVVNKTSDATITPVSPLCQSVAAINLTAVTTGGTWSGTGITNAGNGTFTPSVAGVGNHVITYSITGSCPANDTVTIAVIATYNATITPAGPFCQSDNPVTLSAKSNGGTWSGKGITNATTGIFNPTTAGTGNHIITYTISGACGNTDTVILQVNPLPVANAGQDTTISCPGAAVTFTASGGTTYLWNTGNTTATVGVNPTATTSYIVTVTTGSCSASDTVQVIVNPFPYTVNNDTIVCKGEQVQLNANGGTAYSWTPTTGLDNPSIDNPIATVNSTTQYIVSITNNGCTINDTVVVSIDTSLKADFTASTYSGTAPLGVQFTNVGTQNFASLQWTFGNDNTSNLINPATTYNTSGEYLVTLLVKSSIGCTDTISKTIKVGEPSYLWLPNAFTPNKDSNNELFSVVADGITEFKITIFDRWGELLYESTSVSGNWDGTFKGVECQQDVYVCIVNAKGTDGKTYKKKGTVTLIR